MADLFRRCDIPIIIAHFNHGIRKEANADEEVVRRYAEKNGIRFESEHANIREIAARNKRSIEEQARISRYQFLFELARKEHANYVAVGHTADDQIETILMHLLRGTGISGLCGMSMVNEHSEWGEGITLIRPLLNFWREEISAYCEQYRLTTCLDQTNFDTQYYRNRIRKELVPFLTTFNPKVKQRLLDTASVMQGEREVLERGTSEAWKDVVVREDPSSVLFDLEEFEQLPTGLQRACLRAAARHLEPGLRDLDFQAVERIKHLILKKMNRSFPWFSSIRVEIHHNQFLITKNEASIFDVLYPQVGKEMFIDYSASPIKINQNWTLHITCEDDATNLF